jgi:hypothetical protein
MGMAVLSALYFSGCVILRASCHPPSLISAPNVAFQVADESWHSERQPKRTIGQSADSDFVFCGSCNISCSLLSGAFIFAQRKENLPQLHNQV